MVTTTNVSSASPASSSPCRTAPTPWSSERALALNEAMSARVAAVSGSCPGGAPYSASRTELGSKNSRWVSKNPIDKKNGCCGPLRSSCSAAGAIECTLVVPTSTTWSYPSIVGSVEMCCSPTSADQ